MSSENVKEYQKLIFSDASLIGGMRKKTAAKKLSQQAATGNSEAVKILVLILNSEVEQTIKDIAQQGLLNLQSTKSIKTLCLLWVKKRNLTLEKIILQAKYIPEEPLMLRILILLKMGDTKPLLDMGPDVVDPLIQACGDNDQTISTHAKTTLEQLQNAKAIDEFCKYWYQSRSGDLEKILLQAKYTADYPMHIKIFSNFKQGNPEAIIDIAPENLEYLIKGYRDQDLTIAFYAEKALLFLQNTETIDSLCEHWARTRSSDLEAIILHARYVAKQPFALLILTALKIGAIQKIFDLGVEIADLLLASCNDDDPDVCFYAQHALGQLKHKDDIEMVCDYLMSNGDESLYKIAINNDYSPQKPGKKALFYFMTKQWALYEALDSQPDHPLLREGYNALEPEMRQKVSAAAYANGKIGIFRDMLLARKHQLIGDDIGDREWQAIVESLALENKWDDLWQLLFRVSLPWAAKIVSKLRASGWEVKNLDRDSWEKLITLCPKEGNIFPSTNLKKIKTLQQHKDAVHCLEISPYGNILASTADDKSIALWGLPLCNLLQVFATDNVLLNCIKIAPQEDLLIGGSDEGYVKVWDLPEEQLVNSFQAHTTGISAIVISHDQKILATGSWDGQVKVWKLPELTLQTTFDGHDEGVSCLAINNDATMLASAGGDNIIYIWKVQDGTIVKTVKGLENPVNRILFTGEMLISESGALQNVMRFFHYPDMTLSSLLETQKEQDCTFASPYGELILSQDAKIVVSSDNRELWLLTFPEGKLIKTLNFPETKLYCMAIGSNINILAGGNSDGSITLWNLPWVKPLNSATTHDLDYIIGLINDRHLSSEDRQRWEFLHALLMAKFRWEADVAEGYISMDIEQRTPTKEVLVETREQTQHKEEEEEEEYFALGDDLEIDD